MPEIVENKMVLDWPWDELDSLREDNDSIDNLLRCEYCNEKIKQFRSLHIPSGKKMVWICDRCIEDMKEVTGY